ncbi:MAG: hypothetical protein R3C18_02625 [Planctomycetaceae bacterium]
MHNARSATRRRSMRVIVNPLDSSQRGQVRLANLIFNPLLGADMLANRIQIELNTVRQHHGSIAKASGARAIIIG